MRAALRKLAHDIARPMTAILTPNQALERCRTLAHAFPLEHRTIGHSERGFAIEAYFVGNAPTTVLLYGFPDPGEAVGGSLIVALLEGLLYGEPAALATLPLRWCAIPVLNHDDQPEGGDSLVVVHKSAAVREVDWCVDDPRPETAALLSLAEECQPAVVGALHDEFHSGEPIPAYVAVSQALHWSATQLIRGHLDKLAIPIAAELDHPEMGPGFAVMREMAPDYEQSTFARLEKHGLVIACEVGRYPMVADTSLVEAQAMTLLVAMADRGLLPPPYDLE